MAWSARLLQDDDSTSSAVLSQTPPTIPMTQYNSFKCSLLALAAGLMTSSASAQLTTTLTATAQGWYNSGGDSSVSSAPNFFTGSTSDGVLFNNFFVFDRSTNPLLQFTEIRKATLELLLPASLFDMGSAYYSSDLNDTGALF